MDGHGISGLPVHDSLIVPMRYEETARQVLTAQFSRVVGVPPRMKVNRPVDGHQNSL